MIKKKIDTLKESFFSLKSKEETYKKIIEWGKKLPPFDETWKVEENLVYGCQSLLFLYSSFEEGKLYFFAHSDALISSGLAALLIHVYSGETPETILKTPPKFLEELDIPASLTPGRANGLASLYIKIKKEALNTLVGTAHVEF